MKRSALVLAVLVTLSSPTVGLPQAQDVLPLSFVANQGLTDPDVQFMARGRGYGLFLSPGEINLVLQAPDEAGLRGERRASFVQLALVGANLDGQFEGIDMLPGRAHFLYGQDPTKWRTDLPTFGSVRYPNVYPGIDLLLYGNEGELEYDLVVAPGQDASIVRFAITGGSAPELEQDTGDLVLRLGEHALRLKRPYVYQERNGVRTPILGRYVFPDGADSQVAFQVGQYDRTLPLVIDPVLMYSSFSGGSGRDSLEAVDADASGYAYITGGTFSLDFLNTIDPQAHLGGFEDVFVVKVDPQGQLVYSSFFGGSGNEIGLGITVDDEGHAVVTGSTFSESSFPLVNPAQSSAGNSRDAFVSKLTPDGAHFVYSTYLGGISGRTASGNCIADFEFGRDIDMDTAGNVYVTGYTCAPDFPTTPGAYSPTRPGLELNAFVTKLDPLGQFVYSTYLGGSRSDQVEGIAVDAAGRATVVGDTISNDYPTTANAFQPTPANGFVTQLSADGSSLEYSTYLGGTGDERLLAVAVDAQGNIVVAGLTRSNDFPTIPAGSCPVATLGPSDAFATKIDPSSGSLIFSTCFGGSDSETAWGVIVDAYDNVWVAGVTQSSDFPVTLDALQLMLNGSSSAFVTSLSPDGSNLGFSTYLGGTLGGWATALAHSPGNVFVGGVTASTDFPLANPFQGQTAGDFEGFIAKIEYNEPPSSDSGGPYDVDEGGSVQLTAFGSDPEGNLPVFDWDLDDDGTFETPGETVSFSAADIDGPNTVPVAVRVTDDIGLTSISTTTVEVHNVPPTATFENISGTQVLGAAPASATLAFSNANDPSTDDVAAGFLYSYDCDGDLTFEVTGVASESFDCVYTAAGAFTAGGRIEDKDGGFTDYTAVVEILTPRDGILRLIEKVNTLIDEGRVSRFFGQAMLITLNTALIRFDGGNIGGTVGSLRFFRFLAQISTIFGGLSGQDLSPLLECVDQVIAALGG